MPSRINIHNDRLIFTFPFNPAIIQGVKESFRDAKWNKSHKRWEIPAFTNYLDTLKLILPQPVIVEEDCKNWYNSKMNDAKKESATDTKLQEAVTNFQFKTAPYKHQKETFIWAVIKKSGAIFFECGLGKTKTALDIMQFLYNNNVVKKALIVVPLSVSKTWIDEIPKHTFMSEPDVTSIVTGSIDHRRSILNTTDRKIYIVNYDAVVELKNDIIAKGFDIIICDESTYVKSMKAQRTKAILAISDRIKYKFILTGTPFGQRLTDIYSQLKIIAPSKFTESFWAFRNRYCTMGGYRVNNIPVQVTGYKNTEELNKRISEVAMIYKKTDCLDLPDKIYETRSCQMTDEQAKHYREIIEYLVTIVQGKVIEASMVITQMMKLSQITSGFAKGVKEDEIVRFKQNPKLELLKETLEEISGKVVIWCKFHEDVKMITGILPGNSYRTYTGKTKSEDRDNIINEFNNNDQIQYLIMTSAGGFGLNLQISHNMIFYSHEFSVEDRQQAEDRVHRIGQKSAVTIIDLKMDHSVDEYVLKCCKDKRNIAEGFVSDINNIINEWRR